MTAIRKASLKDVDWLVDIAIKDMFSLLGYDNFYNPIYLKAVLIPHLIEKGIVLVIGEEAALVGSVTPHPFNPEILVATEFMWWVKADRRKSTLGYRLLCAFEDESKKQGANLITLSLMSSSKITSLETRGYVLNEFSYIKEI